MVEIIKFPTWNHFEISDRNFTQENAKHALDLQFQLIQGGAWPFIYWIGFIIFEYGASRPGCQKMAMVKHTVIMVVSILFNFFFGFALSHGDPRLVGTKYFLSVGIDDHPGYLLTRYLTSIMLTAIISSQVIASISSYQTVATQILVTVIICGIVVPLLQAWTSLHMDDKEILSAGFLTRLYFKDEGRCLLLHVVTGFSALALIFEAEGRRGRFRQIMMHQQDQSIDNFKTLKTQQRKIEALARRFALKSPFDEPNFVKQSNPEEETRKLMKIIKQTNCDSFFEYKSTSTMWLGVLTQWIAICNFSAVYNNDTVFAIQRQQQIVINNILAGVAGALGAMIAFKVLQFIKNRANSRRIYNQESSQWNTYENIDDSRKNIFNKKRFYFLNLDLTGFDPFNAMRGMIAGCAAISISPSNYYGIWALANGFIGGILYMMSVKGLHMISKDDSLHVTQAHLLPGLYSMIGVCVFHKDEGYLFKQSQLMVVMLGSNTLAIISATILVIVSFQIVLKLQMLLGYPTDLSKEKQVVGPDTWQSIQKWPKLKNFLTDVANEYQPDGLGDYLMKKQKAVLDLLNKNGDASDSDDEMEAEEVKLMLGYIQQHLTDLTKKNMQQQQQPEQEVEESKQEQSASEANEQNGVILEKAEHAQEIQNSEQEEENQSLMNVNQIELQSIQNGKKKSAGEQQMHQIDEEQPNLEADQQSRMLSMDYSHKFSDDVSNMDLLAANKINGALQQNRGTVKDIEQNTDEDPESSDYALDELRTYRQSETDARKINPSSSIHIKPNNDKGHDKSKTFQGKEAIMSIESQEFQNLQGQNTFNFKYDPNNGITPVQNKRKYVSEKQV